MELLDCRLGVEQNFEIEELLPAACELEALHSLWIFVVDLFVVVEADLQNELCVALLVERAEYWCWCCCSACEKKGDWHLRKQSFEN